MRQPVTALWYFERGIVLENSNPVKGLGVIVRPGSMFKALFFKRYLIMAEA
jgi:hypothetical protein